METKTNEIYPGITQEMIDDAKQKYGEGKVKLAMLPVDDASTSFKHVLLKEPGREAIGQYQMNMERNPNRANEILIRACVIGKEEQSDVLSDVGLFLAALDACSTMIPTRKSIIKNL